MSPLILVVIARNEARCIQRCLRSFAPVVDRMVVLDTGSTDDTPALAQEAGAQVGHFKWVDDFSAARNAALELAGPGWHLVADADEWLQAGGPELRRWCAQPQDRIGRVLIRNDFDARGQDGVCSARLPRLLPAAVRYAGRIHEQPQAGLAQMDLDVVFGHDGYCEAQRGGKSGRNERLLRAALAQQPEDGYLLYQLGCELANRGDQGQARGVLEQALACAPASADYRPDLVRRLLVVLQAAKAWGAGLGLVERELQAHAQSAYFMLTVGNLFWNWFQAEPHEGSVLLASAHDAWNSALELARLRTDGPGMQLEQAGEFAALSLAALHRALGDAAQAAHYEACARAPSLLAA